MDDKIPDFTPKAQAIVSRRLEVIASRFEAIAPLLVGWRPFCFCFRVRLVLFRSGPRWRRTAPVVVGSAHCRDPSMCSGMAFRMERSAGRGCALSVLEALRSRFFETLARISDILVVFNRVFVLITQTQTMRSCPLFFHHSSC